MDSLLGQQLKELLKLALRMHPQQLSYLVTFVGHAEDEYVMQPLLDLLQSATAEQLDALVRASVHSSTNQASAPELEARWGLPRHGLASFGTTLKLHQLQQVLAALNPN